MIIFDYEGKDTRANKLVPIHCSQAKEDTQEQSLKYCFIVHIFIVVLRVDFSRVEKARRRRRRIINFFPLQKKSEKKP